MEHIGYCYVKKRNKNLETDGYGRNRSSWYQKHKKTELARIETRKTETKKTQTRKLLAVQIPVKSARKVLYVYMTLKYPWLWCFVFFVQAVEGGRERHVVWIWPRLHQDGQNGDIWQPSLVPIHFCPPGRDELLCADVDQDGRGGATISDTGSVENSSRSHCRPHLDRDVAHLDTK